MAHCPTPILIVSASTNRGELFKTYDALAAGAVDVLEKPPGDEPDGDVGAPARRHGQAASRGSRSSRIRVRASRRSGALHRSRTHRRSRAAAIAIGASTGGPAALVESSAPARGVFAPDRDRAPHRRAFGAAFADWLDGQIRAARRLCARRRAVATRRSRVAWRRPIGTSSCATASCGLTDDPERHSCRPSVDVLFESLARELGASCAGLPADRHGPGRRRRPARDPPRGRRERSRRTKRPRSSTACRARRCSRRRRARAPLERHRPRSTLATLEGA